MRSGDGESRDIQKLMSRSEAVLKMYTSISNGEDVETASKEFREWNEQRIREIKDSLTLC